jgi:hypothetical protein
MVVRGQVVQVCDLNPFVPHRCVLESWYVLWIVSFKETINLAMPALGQRGTWGLSLLIKLESYSVCETESQTNKTILK